MVISEVSISNLRATQENKVNLSPGINILYGKNGTGKTTILEAISLLSFGKSFKTNFSKTLIGEKNNPCGAFLKTNKNNVIKIKIFQNNKTLTLDDFKIKKISDHVGFLPTLVSSPDETTIEGKQNFPKQQNVNKVLCIINKNYLDSLKKYNYTLKQRNAALKADTNFEIWDEGLVNSSKKIWEKREWYEKKINKTMEMVNRQHKTNKQTEIKIKGTKTALSEIIKEIKNNTQKDTLTKQTNSGPQKDKIEYFINGKSIKDKASQGEKNLYFSILKKAESIIIKAEIKKEPIILLDDIFSKLDKENILLLLKMFKENKQTIITHTEKINKTTAKQTPING